MRMTPQALSRLRGTSARAARLTNIDLTLEICELIFGPSAVDRSVDGLVDLHAILAAFPAPVFYFLPRRRCLQLHVKIAEHIPAVGANAHVGLHIRRERHVNIPV